MNLTTPVEEISRVGPQYQKRLKKLGINTIYDLIFHFPHRYEDFSNLIPIASADSQIGKTVCLQGKIINIKNIRIFKRRMVITEATIQDKTGEIKVTWFNQSYLINTFKKGDFVFLAGKITLRKTKKYLSSPSYEKIPGFILEDSNNNLLNFDGTHLGRLVPIYPETEGLSSRWLRFVIKPILTKIKDELPDTLPENIRKKYNFEEIKKAIWQIHFPDSLQEVEKAKKRFSFEKLFNLSLVVLREKMNLTKEKTTAVPINLEIIKKFVKQLPFKLTVDQRKTSWQILQDMEKTRPMNRLLNGDVGSGKTIVAIIALLNAIKAGFQASFMAPTEILAKQHHQTLIKTLKNFKFKIGLITGKENYFNLKKIKRPDLLKKTKDGEIDILIGTHALIRKTVEFKELALVIIDEQHRFGTEQRAELTRKQNFIPHFLSMSATPIPRTLALTIYGDLDLSLIKELPKGRKKIITKIIPPEKRKDAYDFIKKEVKLGRQVFVICPRIEPTENNQNLSEAALSWQDVKAVKQEYEKLKKDVFPDLNISMLHGRMKTEEKEKVLKSFKNDKTDILVSTSVIEVGIDFPNATVMAIEGSDKFGLAQLHQFRGRVGRGKEQSYCFLFSDFLYNPRLKAMVKSQDGFELAEKDLKLRGPGDIMGQKQWGFPDFVMNSLQNIELVEKSREAAKEILQIDPELKKYPLLAKEINKLKRKIHLE